MGFENLKDSVKIKKMKKLIFSCLTLSLLLIPIFVLADDAPPCSGVICDPLNSNGNISVLIDRIINFLLYLAAPIAVLMTVYAGFLFITRGDKPEEIKKASKMLLYIVIGVIVLILSKSVVGFVNSFLTP